MRLDPLHSLFLFQVKFNSHAAIPSTYPVMSANVERAARDIAYVTPSTVSRFS